MGLDMYVVTVAQGNLVQPDQQVDVQCREGTKAEKMCYWRKFNHLHGWMERLYREKGGQDPDFNCNTVRLEEADLVRLEAEVAQGPLPAQRGFFFGSPEWHPEDAVSISDFIAKARSALADGRVVLYDSWW